MEGMGQIARLATFAAAFVLTVLSFFLPWFWIELMGGLNVELNAIPFRGNSGLEVILCDECEPVGTGRLAGGLAWLASYVAFQFAIAIVVSGVQVLRGYRSPSITLWTTLPAIGLGLLVLGVLASFGARAADVEVSSKPAPWFLLGACVLAAVGHSRVFDRLDPPPLIEAVPPPVQIERLQPVEAPARKAPTHVRAADVGHAGMRITTEAGSMRLAWEDVARIQLIAGVEPGVELTTRDAILRITRKSEVDYRFIPGAVDGSDAEKLRCLYEYARERNPSLRLTP